MKNLFLLLASISCLVASASAELFVGSNTEVNRIIVPSNHVMIISSVKFGRAVDFNQLDDGTPVRIVTADATNTVQFRDFGFREPVLRYAITGACEVSFPVNFGAQDVSAPIVVNYKLVQGTQIRSIVSQPEVPTVIQVPAGKTVRFFSPSVTQDDEGFAIQQGDNTVYDVNLVYGDEITGPATVTLPNRIGVLVSYFFTEDFVVLPDLGYIQGPTGSFEITVEKSTDMLAWSSVVVHGTASDQKSFFRLKLTR
ncbi:MAG: hypothetical protein IPK15_14430 [Verrucomicrobia bacterium]|nr:hypothetical protein [Verrucomicrobiota bacterium]